MIAVLLILIIAILLFGATSVQSAIARNTLLLVALVPVVFALDWASKNWVWLAGATVGIAILVAAAAFHLVLKSKGRRRAELLADAEHRNYIISNREKIAAAMKSKRNK